MNERIENIHARILCEYSLGLKAGDNLCIRGNVAALPLIRAVFTEALKRGVFPQVRITDEVIEENLLKYGTREQIQFVPKSEYTMVRSFNAYLTIMGNFNTRALSNIAPEKVRMHSQGRKEYSNIFFNRWAKKEIRCCVTLYPSQGDAQEAGMSTAEYEDFVYNACMLHEADPVAEWKKIECHQERLCACLGTKKRFRVLTRDTDLTCSIEGRRWINCCGKVNLPDGEVFTAPVENSVNGHIRFSFPGIYHGREVEDIRLVFEAGRVVDASAARGQDLLVELLDTDCGARCLGEIAVGTNRHIERFTRNMLFDEKIGGTVHCALGRAFPESGGINESTIHWDMLCDMKQDGKIFTDDELIYENGGFLI
jgi:aminopeptidase